YGIKYHTVYLWNGDTEDMVLEHPRGVTVFDHLKNKDGADIYMMSNNGIVNTYKFPNGDKIIQNLEYRGGYWENATRYAPEGSTKYSEKPNWDEETKTWRIDITYPNSNQQSEIKNTKWRDGPMIFSRLYSPDKTLLKEVQITKEEGDKFSQIIKFYGRGLPGVTGKGEIKVGGSMKYKLVRQEDRLLFFIDGPQAQGKNVGTIIDYCDEDELVPFREQLEKSWLTKFFVSPNYVKYKVDVTYDDNYNTRTEEIVAVDNAERQHTSKLKRVCGEWKPIETWSVTKIPKGKTGTKFEYNPKTGDLDKKIIRYTENGEFKTKVEYLVRLDQLEPNERGRIESLIKIIVGIQQNGIKDLPTTNIA
ncbi:MAG: hypothetical protein QME68_08785, partial [Elusimicrobiota bacterium]|nr:hypothetical protein [Elusimicrobiota bacterium]